MNKDVFLGTIPAGKSGAVCCGSCGDWPLRTDEHPMEGVDLVLYFKHLAVLKGEAAYRLNINETDALSPAQARVCEAQFHQFSTWFANWSKQGGVLAECM